MHANKLDVVLCHFPCNGISVELRRTFALIQNNWVCEQNAQHPAQSGETLAITGIDHARAHCIHNAQYLNTTLCL